MQTIYSFRTRKTRRRALERLSQGHQLAPSILPYNPTREVRQNNFKASKSRNAVESLGQSSSLVCAERARCLAASCFAFVDIYMHPSTILPNPSMLSTLTHSQSLVLRPRSITRVVVGAGTRLTAQHQTRPTSEPKLSGLQGRI